MKVKIVEELITVEPRPKFYCMVGTNKLRIKDIRADVVTMETGEQYPVDDIAKCILKYTGIIENPKSPKKFPLLYEDYGRVSDGQIVEGYLQRRPKTVREEDAIRITDINIIDELGLYDLPQREGEVIRIIYRKWDNKYEIQFKNVRGVKTLNREQFMLIEEGVPDSNLFFHPRCDECKN